MDVIQGYTNMKNTMIRFTSLGLLMKRLESFMMFLTLIMAAKDFAEVGEIALRASAGFIRFLKQEGKLPAMVV